MAVERVLSYPRQAVSEYDGVSQQRSWDCGPASAQIILAGAGIHKSEQYLIDEIGTTVNGTNHAGLITPILNELLPGSGYESVWLPKEPVSKAQVEALWKSTVKSIDGNRGVILNFEAPPTISLAALADQLLLNIAAGILFTITRRGWDLLKMTMVHVISGLPILVFVLLVIGAVWNKLRL